MMLLVHLRLPTTPITLRLLHFKKSYVTLCLRRFLATSVTTLQILAVGIYLQSSYIIEIYVYLRFL